MKLKLHLRFIVLALMAGIHPASAQTFTLRHSFASGEGVYPVGTLIQSNATLYGMTTSDVFKMNTNGGSCSNLHSFGGLASNASGPHAALTLSGTNLYGMTVEGGAGVGVAFRVSTNGIGYTALHYFNGRETNGSKPYGSLTLANGALYGTTFIGGASNLGTLFRMNTSGGGYTNLHVFAGGAADGANPEGDLTLSGTNFYGLASQGGAAGLGVVFRVNTNGTGYTNLHSFAGYPNDGAGPPGSLTLAGSTLYGMTQEGGPSASRLGAVFKINTDGSDYRILHFFAGGTGDGATPLGSLTLANGWLYGMTSVGGASNKGTVFRVSTDGSSYTNFHSFAGGTNDGATPYGSLLLSGSTLYGMTYYGGSNNVGVMFTLSNLPSDPPASLTMIYTNQRAIVSWPSWVSGCTLQTNAVLNTTNWGNYAGAIINNTATNLPTQGKLFFRLKYP